MLFAYGKIWDLRDVRHPRQVTSARQAALWVAFSADGKTLAEFDDDGLASLYHIGGSGGLTLTGRLPVFGGVASMAFSQNGDLLTVMYVNRPVQLWSVKGRRLLATLPNSSSATFSPDGRTLAVADTEDRTVQLLNTTNPRRPALTAALTGVLAPIVFPGRPYARRERCGWNAATTRNQYPYSRHRSVLDDCAAQPGNLAEIPTRSYIPGTLLTEA
jgi:WD40 repeat protein